MREVEIIGGPRSLVSLCDRSAIALRPWAEAGHPCTCVDLLPPAEPLPPGVAFVQADVRRIRIAGGRAVAPAGSVASSRLVAAR